MSARDRLRRAAARALIAASRGLWDAFVVSERAGAALLDTRREARELAKRVDVRLVCSLCALVFARCELDEEQRCWGCALVVERSAPCADPSCEACGPEIVS